MVESAGPRKTMVWWCCKRVMLESHHNNRESSSGDHEHPPQEVLNGQTVALGLTKCSVRLSEGVSPTHQRTVLPALRHWPVWWPRSWRWELPEDCHELGSWLLCSETRKRTMKDTGRKRVIHTDTMVMSLRLALLYTLPWRGIKLKQGDKKNPEALNIPIINTSTQSIVFVSKAANLDLFSYSKLIQNWVMTKRSKTVWSNSLEGCVLCLAEFTWTASMWQRSAHTFPGMRSNLRKIQKHDTVSPDSGGTIRAGCCEQTIHTGTEWET